MGEPTKPGGALNYFRRERLGDKGSRDDQEASTHQRWRTMVSKRWSVVLAGALLSMSVAACGNR